MPIELTSAAMKLSYEKPEKNFWSPISSGFLSDSDAIQTTGIRAYSRTTRMPMPQSPRSLLVWVTSGLPSLLGGAGPERLHEEDGDQDHADEDQDRDRRAEPDVDPVDQDVVAEDRHALGVESASRLDDVDVVEDPERVERPEQERDQDRRLHQRDGDPEEALGRGGAVDLRCFMQLVWHERQAGQQQ